MESIKGLDRCITTQPEQPEHREDCPVSIIGELDYFGNQIICRCEKEHEGLGDAMAEQREDAREFNRK